MDLTWNRVDLLRSAAAGVDNPGLVVPRKPGEQWVVCQSPVTMAGKTDFTLFADEEQFYVPLYPYLLHREPDLAFAAMYCGPSYFTTRSKCASAFSVHSSGVLLFHGQR